MIERKWKPENHKLEDAFFPVELCDLKFVYPAETDLFGKVVRTEDVLAKGHKAVVDINKCHVFATVTDKYKLVTNEDAYKWAEPVVGAVFNHSQLKDFDCFNVRMTGTRSSCCIDLIRKLDGGNVISFLPFGEDDPWTAFIRIINSYNKTSCLKYQLGFCRWICQNGMIFESKSVDFVFTHTKGVVSGARIRQQLAAAARERIGEIRTLEDQFIAKLRNLKKHSIPQNVMLALACKVFNLHLTRDDAAKMSDVERKKAVKFVQKIKDDTREYYGQFGANAYAAMNVLTDFASYPQGLSGVNTVPVLQAKAGAWIDDFVEASEKPGFNMTKYLGTDAIEAAMWYESLVAA